MSENTVDRKSFISKSFRGIVGISLLSVIPFKLFSSNDKKKFRVNINKDAVKRNR